MSFDTTLEPRLGRRRLLGGIGALALVTAGGLHSVRPVQAAWPGENFVVSAGNDLIRAARDGSEETFRALLKKYVDLNGVAKFALGRYRSSFPEASWGEYHDLLERFMAQTLRNYRDKFKGEKFQVTNSRQTNTGLFVESFLKFLGGRTKQPVDWKLVGGPGNWRVFDINFQQVWLAVLLRDTFTKEIQKSGNNATAVLAYLRTAVEGGQGATVGSS